MVGADLLRRARQLSDASTLVLGEDHELAASAAALAGVSAADAITCIRLSRRSSVPDHHDAPTLLAQADDRGPQAAAVIEHLLRLRDRRPTRTPITSGEARRAVAHAAHLVTFAERLAFGSAHPLST